MNRFKFFAFFCVISLFVAILFSCKNLLWSQQDTLLVFSNSSKVVYEKSLENISEITLEGTQSSSSFTTLDSWTSYSDFLEAKVKVSPGHWMFRLTAYINEDPYSQTIETEIIENTSNYLSFSLSCTASSYYKVDLSQEGIKNSQGNISSFTYTKGLELCSYQLSIKSETGTGSATLTITDKDNGNKIFSGSIKTGQKDYVIFFVREDCAGHKLLFELSDSSANITSAVIQGNWERALKARFGLWQIWCNSNGEANPNYISGYNLSDTGATFDFHIGEATGNGVNAQHKNHFEKNKKYVVRFTQSGMTSENQGEFIIYYTNVHGGDSVGQISSNGTYYAIIVAQDPGDELVELQWAFNDSISNKDLTLKISDFKVEEYIQSKDYSSYGTKLGD